MAASASLLEHASGWLLEAAGGAGTAARSRHATHDAAQADPAAHTIRRSSIPVIATTFVCLFALLVRYGVSGGSYSGAGAPPGSPLYGDFEAQRHWMEVTLNLPIAEWYQGNHPHNDLQYWGLDYPPLTAYVSYACGWVARAVGVPELVELGSSRGHESAAGKLFMRTTVMVCDAILCIPAIVLAMRAINGADTSPAVASSASSASAPSAPRILVLVYLALLHPAFILIDHGHFQYNCVSLGLVALAVFFVWRRREYSASICFVLALTFKQMSLYYAPAFFAYLLARTRQGERGKAVGRATTLLRLAVLGSVVLGTMALVFLPFLRSFPLLAQVVHRMFPFARGLYEDKVANFWCATSVLVKWHLWFPRETMVRAALGATVASLLPSCILAYLRPSRRSFLYALAGSSMSFYLFSFQVHEKSVLLPLLPLVLLWGQHPLINAWIGGVATFSMYPLLQKDGHSLTYFALQAAFVVQALSFARSQMRQTDPTASTTAAADPSWAARIVQRANARSMLMYRMVQLSLFGCLCVHLLAAFLPPIPRYPDLASMLFVLYAAPQLLLCHALMLLHQLAMPAGCTEDVHLQPVGEPVTIEQQQQRKKQ